MEERHSEHEVLLTVRHDKVYKQFHQAGRRYETEVVYLKIGHKGEKTTISPVQHAITH